MRRILTIAALLLVLQASLGSAQNATGVYWGRGPEYDSRFWNWPNGAGNRWHAQVEQLLAFSGSLGPDGKIWYVDSEVSNEGSGGSWDRAFDTLDEAIAASSADSGAGRGDVILLAPGHNEALGTGADVVDVDVDGLTIIGVGKGDDMALFDYTDYDTGTFAVGADNVTLVNLRFHANVTDVNEAIDVEAGSTYLTVQSCLFDAESEGTDEFHECIKQGGAVADGLRLLDCRFRMGAGGARCAIDFRDADYAQILGNIFDGDYAVADVNNATTASNHIRILGNSIFNGTIGGNAGLNTEPCIELLGTTTGIIDDCALVCNLATPDVAVVGADMYLGPGNWYSESEATAAPPLWFSADTSMNLIGYNDADNAASTSSVVANANGTLVEGQKYIESQITTAQYGQPQLITKAAVSLISGTVEDVFTIAGGDILVLYLGTTLTTACSNNSVTMGYTWDPTAGAGTDTPIASGVDVDSAAIGDTIWAEGDATAAIIAAIGTKVPQVGINGGFILGPGGVDIEMGSSNLTTGAGTAKMIYIPLSSAATVAAP